MVNISPILQFVIALRLGSSVLQPEPREQSCHIRTAFREAQEQNIYTHF